MKIAESFSGHDILKAGIAGLEIGFFAVVGYYLAKVVADVLVKFMPMLSGFVDFIVLAIGIIVSMHSHSWIKMFGVGAIVYSSVKIVDGTLGPMVAGGIKSVEGAVGLA
jgi:hypothetical protein